MRLALDAGDGEASILDCGLQALGRRGIANVKLLELVAFDGREARREGLGLGGRELGKDRPVFLGLEPLDLQLAVADQSEGHRLHPARGAGAGQLSPQHWGEGEAHEVIERSARQIGIDQGSVDGARMTHGVEHGLLSHGVEHHTLDLDLVQGVLAVEHLEHVPGDGFTLPVWVGGEDELVRALQRLDDLIQPFRRLGLHVPMHLEILVGQHRPVLRGQVAHMAVGGQHPVARAEILIDGLCLCRQFHDDDVH